MKIAFATSDKKSLYDAHFGDADLYTIYEVSNNQFQYLGDIINTVKSPEHDHEDFEEHKNKAGKILALFKQDDIQVLVNKAFGTNITKISSKVLPVISRIDSIEDVIRALQLNFNTLSSVLTEQSKAYLILQNDSSIRVNTIQ